MAKRKKEKQNKKPRIPIITIGFDRDVEISNINVDEEKKLVFTDKHGNVLFPSSVSVGDSYMRTTKPKVLRQLPTEPNDIRLDTRQLLKKNDMTLVVDTNYEACGEFLLCVSASMLIQYEMVNSSRIANCHPQDFLVFGLVRTEKPERFGWWDIVERFVNSSLSFTFR